MDKNEALLARIRHKNLTTASSLRPACILRIQIEVEKILPTEFAFIFRYKDMDSTPGAAPQKTKGLQRCRPSLFPAYGQRHLHLAI